MGQVVLRARQRSEVQHHIERAPPASVGQKSRARRIGHFEPKVSVPHQMGEIGPRPSDEIVEAHQFVPITQQALAQMRTNKASRSGQ